MSVILITHHSENIYDVITTEKEEKLKRDVRAICHPTKGTTYVSKFQKYRDDYVKGIKARGIMGVAEQELPDPSNYLKKREGKQIQPDLSNLKPKDNINKPKQQPTPTHAECKDRIITHKYKNFVSENIKKISTLTPKEPEPRVALDRTGNTKPLKAGLEPIFIKAKDFGRAPRYLLDIINNSKRKYLALKEKHDFKKPKCRYVCREERTQLLEGLKRNWEELQNIYQGLPILTDTIPKILRKARIEQNLNQLEKDIQLIERHPYLYVYDDDNFP